MCERRVSRDRESSPLSMKLYPSLSFPSLSPLAFPRTVIPSPPFRIESPGMVGRYALRGSGRRAAESSLALEGAFNWIRLIRLNSPSLTFARARTEFAHLNSTGAIILAPLSSSLSRFLALYLLSSLFQGRAPAARDCV